MADPSEEEMKRQMADDDAEVARIMAMSDEDILAEAKKNGWNSNEARARFDSILEITLADIAFDEFMKRTS